MSEKMQSEGAMLDGRLRQAQLKMLSILKVIDAICQKHQLDYWLEGGTLLGAVRHQGFIPWDDDLDISMTRASAERFAMVAPKELPDHLFFQSAQTDRDYYNLAAPFKVRDLNSRFVEIHETGEEAFHQGIFVDIFVYDKFPESQLKTNYWQLLSKKLLRLIRPKYTALPLGHHAGLYHFLSHFFSKKWLENKLNNLIKRSMNLESPWLGYGLDSVNNNRVHQKDIFPLKQLVFEDSTFPVAYHFETILIQLYGDYMQLPPEEKRHMGHCRELLPDWQPG